MESDIYKKEYSLTDMLSAAWRIFSGNAATIIAITLMITIPVTLINIAANEIFTIDWMNDPTLSPEDFSAMLSENLGDIIMSFLTLVAVSMVLSFVSLLSSMALAFYVKSCIDQKKISIQAAYSRALGRWPASIWTNILQSILLLLLFLMFVIPGIIYWIYWTFAVYAVALSGKSGKDALDYSKKIVKDRWWTVLGYTLVFAIIGFILSIPIILALGALRWGMTDPLTGYAVDASGSMLFSLVGSFMAVIQIVFYLNYESTMGIKKQY
jgi:hypothetical protein